MPSPGPASAPDTIYLHGNLLTMDARCPTAQALAVAGDRLLAVGSDAEIAALARPHTLQVNLEGHFVLPGFHDAHTHQLSTGLVQLDLDLGRAASLHEFQQRILAHARTLAPGEWLLGSQWDHTLWPGQNFPTRQDLDPFTAGHPAYLVRLDVHAAVANTLALAAAGVTAATPIPSGGKIGADAAGQPNGMLFEDARALVSAKIPVPTPARRRRALELAMRAALRHGVTSVQDYSDWDCFLTYEQMQREGALQFRVSEWLDFSQPLPALMAQRAHRGRHDPWLRTGLLKAFLDGSLGSRTAALQAPYADDPGNCGNLQYSPAELRHMARERAAAGFQLGFHAIGDRAVALALDAFEAAQSLPPAAPAPRHRIEHLQMIAPGDLARMRQLGAIASVQPSHLLDDQRWAQARIGADRARHSYLWNSFLRAGVTLAFGSDCPVASSNPMLGLYAAVTRARADGRPPYPPAGESLDLAAALYACTMGGAIADFSEAGKGSLTPGKLADFVVLSQDLRRVPPAAILDTTVLRTVVGGQVMWPLPND